MQKERILVVDDEKNIRLTLTQALEDMAEIDTAMNGEEALSKIAANDYRLMLLDLKMPGMDGMDVLRRISRERPDIRIVIVTAHGNVESAVEAMKLGAVDFIRKPFSPSEIRALAGKVLDRHGEDAGRAAAFEEQLAMARGHIRSRLFDAAQECLRKAAALVPDRPETANLLGAVHELLEDRSEAVKHYRAAYWLAPSYAPSRRNIERMTTRNSTASARTGLPDLGDTPKAED